MRHRTVRREYRVLGLLCVVLSIASCLPSPAMAAPSRSAAAYEVTSYALAPDGLKYAEVLRSSVAAPGIEEIEVKSTSGVGGNVVYVGSGIESVYWMNSDEILFTKGAKTSVIEWENIKTLARAALFRSRHSIYVAAYDRRHGLLAYAYVIPWGWHGRNSVRVKGGMTTLELISPVWARWPSSEEVGAFRIFDDDGKPSARKIVLSKKMFSMPPTLVWSHGRLLAVADSRKSLHTKIYDTKTGRRILSQSPIYRVMSMAASNDGDLAVVTNRTVRERPSRLRCGCTGSLNLFVLNRNDDMKELSALAARRFVLEVGGMWFSGKDKVFVDSLGFARPGGVNRWRLDEVNTITNTISRVFRWPHGDLGSSQYPCQFDARRTLAICVAQTLRDPPRLIAVNLVSGKMHNLGKIDSSQHKLGFAFKDVKVRSSFGTYSTGFLAVPRHAMGKRVPLAVMAYGFSESYSKDAQWITSYPIRKFVHAGIAVMLVNWAHIDDRGYSRFVASKRAQESAVATFANAIPAAQDAGLKVSRAMVLGWSFGGLFAADAIQKLHRYVAAEVGDPADYNVTEFALGGSFWRLQSKLFFGGAPIGRNLERYQHFDPSGTGKAANGPILFEFVSRNPDAGQFLEEWKATGTSVEAFAYRRSVHWLSVPEEAKISRKRNLYWAELNLLGPKAVSPVLLRSVGL